MLDHFGLRCRPFTREVPTRDAFKAPFLDEQLEQIVDAIHMRMSALVIAPPGLGKTLLLRRVRERLPETRFATHYLKVPRLSARDLCREVSFALGAKSAGNYPALVRSVQTHMEQVADDQGIKPVIMLDDAHGMKDQGFELLKILTNFQMDSKLVVSFVLAGHQALKERLSRTDLSDVRQRLIHCGQLRLLSRNETADYLSHRLRLAGATTALFDETAIEALYDISRGNMRAIDNLSLKSLSYAAKNGDKIVNQNHIAQAGVSLWT